MPNDNGIFWDLMATNVSVYMAIENTQIGPACTTNLLLDI
jgi:hypothetical protein